MSNMCGCSGPCSGRCRPDTKCQDCLDNLQWDFRYAPGSSRILSLDINCGTKSVDISRAFRSLELWELKNVDDTITTAEECDFFIFDGLNWTNKHVKEVACMDYVGGFDNCGCPLHLANPGGAPTKYLRTNSSGAAVWQAIGGPASEIDLTRIAMVNADGDIVYADMSGIIDAINSTINNAIAEYTQKIKAITDRIYGWPLSGDKYIASGNMNAYKGAMNGGIYIKTHNFATSGEDRSVMQA